jgi:hypothetical protein
MMARLRSAAYWVRFVETGGAVVLQRRAILRNEVNCCGASNQFT